MSKEAEKLAEQLRDMVPRYRTPSHERGVLNDAIQTIRCQAKQITELREAARDLVDCYCEIGNPMSKNDRMRHMLALNKARVLSNTKEAE